MGKYHGKVDVKKLHYNMGTALDEPTKIRILQEAFYNRCGYPLNLEKPRTMNEKIMWLKLYYQDPLITKCADKFAVKDYVNEVLGPGHVVPTIAAWDDPEKIDFDSLPERFVLKVNWSSGYNIIVRDKSKLDIPRTVETLKRWMQPDRNAYYQYFNWGYKHMKAVVYAEEYLDQIDGQVYDYKFFMCGGKYKYMLIATDRTRDDTLTHDFYDENFNWIDVQYGELKNAVKHPEKPSCFDEMVRFAEKLAKPFPFVRVDFYEVAGQVYLGEMTFYPAGGLKTFYPLAWDTRFGDMIPLPEKRVIDRDSAFAVLSRFRLKAKEKLKAGLHRVREVFLRKETVGKNNYIRFLGMRFGYSKYVEKFENRRKEYIRIEGMDFCRNSRELSPAKVENTNTAFKYAPNNQLTAFMMEPMMTKQIQRIHCEQKAYKQLGYFPDLRHPKTLNEKIIWLALNYKNPDIVVAADKTRAKDWMARRISREHLVPTIGVYEDVNDIDFNALPDKFVAKLNDGWGADKVMIVRNKAKLDIDQTKAVLSGWLYPWNNYYYQNMCITDEKMPEPRIIIEKYLETKNDAQVPEDFKFYCCNGEPRFALVVADRGTRKQTRAFVDMNWNIMPVTRVGYGQAKKVEVPTQVEKMKELARTLSQGFPFVRIDFYEVDGKVYVGEMTFTPGMFLRFSSTAWDLRLGKMLKLPGMEEEPSNDPDEDFEEVVENAGEVQSDGDINEENDEGQG